ncbi:23S rRNA (adenine(2503)-C(2))-methyltransferase RlmN [Parachlamydia sp. AcF125]|uniref:23S rRNA (adenine(2503)-C(2))-methyltransferase RlmN n=1 Tax=Parachlamydia sp. AcF125 TaxID=2795736 RepID=UPI001BC98DF0|nr:23S rRNA (adenine(2503)-C(2))-methyltransferase RlmN [Parachlamydia sp. AcF125]MBS4168590.1 putative dual-specificity RNA methyltransferase RlmN [Parachlamydia sp. AcF125]
MHQFFEMTEEELKSLLISLEQKPFHAKQLMDWVYGKGIMEWGEMTNMSSELKKLLQSHISLSHLQLVHVKPSADLETYKFLWRLKDNKLVESVLICSRDRRTVCVSSQVGCPAKCAFCASGKQGFFRNLRPHEIVEQVFLINRWLKEKGERVSHVVYMGMGEPLKNYDSVVKSIRLLSNPDLLNLSQRRITVSTVGIVEGIKRLSREGLKVSLVLSLHAPNQHIRQKIIPYARKYPLEAIMEAMEEYAELTKRDITFEYTLIAGINDHPDHAFELTHLLHGKNQFSVNLIPYNPVPGLRLRRPDKKAIKQFRAVLFGAKIVNTCRYTKGEDIAAACGQLALQELEKEKIA